MSTEVFLRSVANLECDQIGMADKRQFSKCISSVWTPYNVGFCILYDGKNVTQTNVPKQACQVNI